MLISNSNYVMGLPLVASQTIPIAGLHIAADVLLFNYLKLGLLKTKFQNVISLIDPIHFSISGIFLISIKNVNA